MKSSRNNEESTYQEVTRERHGLHERGSTGVISSGAASIAVVRVIKRIGGVLMLRGDSKMLKRLARLGNRKIARATADSDRLVRLVEK